MLSMAFVQAEQELEDFLDELPTKEIVDDEWEVPTTPDLRVRGFDDDYVEHVDREELGGEA